MHKNRHERQYRHDSGDRRETKHEHGKRSRHPHDRVVDRVKPDRAEATDKRIPLCCNRIPQGRDTNNLFANWSSFNV
jgi:hypothetical protein